MGRLRQYESDAERQKAYRERLRAGTPKLEKPLPRRRPPSRPARLIAIQEAVQRLHDEYSEWLSAIPEPFHDTDQAQRLQETVEQLETVLDLISEIQLPRGFGRD